MEIYSRMHGGIYDTLKGKQQYIFFDLLIRASKVTVTCIVNFLITCLVSEILKDKERQRHYSSAILDIEKPHDVTTWVIVFSLKEATNKYVECSNPTEFVCIYFLRKLRSIEENFIEI